MSRIYIVERQIEASGGAAGGDLKPQYVRAHNLNQAIRAVANKTFWARPVKAEELLDAGVTAADVIDALGADSDDERAPVPKSANGNGKEAHA